MKVQLEFEGRAEQNLNELKERTDSKTYRDLFNNLLTLFQWAVEQRASGRRIASIDDNNQTYREVLMPALEAAAGRVAVGMGSTAEAVSPPMAMTR